MQKVQSLQEDERDMKLFATDVIFGFSWNEVVAGFWKRYPNPYSKHVLTEDVIERKVDGDKLITKRLIRKTSRVPKWGQVFVKSDSTYMVEESILDLAKKTFVTYTRNIGLQKVMSIDEKCTYMPNLEGATGSNSTLCHRQAAVCSGVPGFSRVISSYGVKRFKANTDRAVWGFEIVLNRLYMPDFDEAAWLLARSKTEKFKDSAKKAKEFAKSSAEKAKAKVLHQQSCDSGEQ